MICIRQSFAIFCLIFAFLATGCGEIYQLQNPLDLQPGTSLNVFDGDEVIDMDDSYLQVPNPDQADNYSDDQNNPNDADADGVVSRSEQNEVSFVSFGDWGDGSTRQKAVANEIGNYCQNWQCDFVVTLGDNFYQKGVTDIYDDIWRARYQAIYGHLNLPFFAALGNHDVLGNVQAQIDYSNIDSSWHMPAEDYSIVFPEESQAPIVEIFVINTGDNEFGNNEETWLTDAIAKSKATWKILVGHIPIISNGWTYEDGDMINGDRLISAICDKVDLVLGGHHHIFSYLSGKSRKFDVDCSVEQLIIGTGGAGTYDYDPRDLRAHISANRMNGFGWFNVTHDELVFKMIKTNGDIFYETSWHKP